MKNQSQKNDENKKLMTQKENARSYHFGGIEEFSFEEVEKEVIENKDIYLGSYLDVFAGSDGRYKQEFEQIENPLKKIRQLSGLTYEWNRTDNPDKNFPEGREVGLIAQDVEQVLPEAIHTDEDGFKRLNYGRVTPLMVESIKDLSELVALQNIQIHELKKELTSLKEKSGIESQFMSLS